MRWNPFARKASPSTEQTRSVSVGDPALGWMLGLSSPDGITVSESTAMTLSAVFRAVSLVSGSIASLPLRTVLTKADGTKERSSSFLDNPGGDRFTPFEWKELVAVFLLIHGNCFLQHMFNGVGTLVALNPIHPSSVTVHWDSSRPGGKRFDVEVPNDNGTKTTKSFDSSTMTHIMGISLDGLKGVSPIGLARTSMSTGMAGDKSALRQFTNGASISGMVTPIGDAFLEEPEANAVKKSVNANMTGVENAGTIAVINKDLKFTAWQMNAADAQFLESRTFQIDEVGRWFGVPPHLLGLTEKSTSWGQGIAEQNRGLARYTLTPWTSRIDERVTRLLKGKRIAEFDFKAFVKPSPEDEINLLIAQVNSGLLTLNEARKILNLPSLEGGDLPRVPAGAAAPTAEPSKEEVPA